MGKIFKGRQYWSGDTITRPLSIHKDCILVATTNVEGRSGAGIAKIAVDYWGAQYGQAKGLSGQCYLLPTKNLTPDYFDIDNGVVYTKAGPRSLTEKQIKSNIEEMYCCARSLPEKSFLVAYKRQMKNLNGYSARELWDMFTKDTKVPINIVFHSSFKRLPITTG